MAQIPNLDNAPVNLTSIREQSQKELLNILKNVRGKKCLVIDPKLGDSLSLIIQTSILKEHGVELRHLSSDPIQTDCSKVVYLVHAQPKLMKFICSNIHNDLSKGLQREYHVYFVPRRTVVCEKVLEEEKLHHMVSIGEYPLYIVPMDEDVLSFELDLSYKECQVDGDTGSLWHIAKAIHKLEFSFGVIPNVRAKGKASVCVADILNRMQAEEPVNSSDIVVPEINTLILLDREVDMVTPLCSQLTYEGLLDEFLHINNGSVELDASIMGLQQEGKKTKVPLNSSDKLFKEIRDLNFEVVVQILRQKATSMKQDYTEMTTTTQTVSELKDFVKKLNSLPEMTRHINLAQHLSTFTSKPSFLGQLDMEHTIVESQSYDICFDYIEELIHKQEPLTTVLRLLILFSITNSGLPKKHFDYFRRELLHSYGFEHVAMLNNLEKAGLFKKQESKSNWVTIKRALQLVVEDTDTANPNDIAYVFSGYAPLSIRLVQHAIRSGWRPVEEILKLLPGPHLETKRGGFSNSPSFDTLSGVSTTSLAKVPDGRRALVLVVFVGGVTFAEISALRFFSTQVDFVAS
ncbi:vacuolar protein-sorting-associated protein 33 homolog isoform X2 [Vigna unguiculata]|uniref:vacuolar protein-sorting-associated protein 33 homolog isoform X2 n=1 Tax=Vigna unguiculata TaxID=3917 RepID=UPI001015D08D|nr:vacuolar protein-sorting-associated protein 33 homolog isoform X2 [Vigna unguiculata]